MLRWESSIPTLPDYNQSVRGYSYDPAKGKELWGQCGWQQAIIVKVSPRQGFLTVYYQAVEDSLKRTLGVAVTLESIVDFNVLLAEVKAGRIPVYLLGWGPTHATSATLHLPSG